MGPRVCQSHFNTTDIIVKENKTRLKKDTLPKSDIKGDVDKNLIFISTRDGMSFPTHSGNVAAYSPYIRRILQDWREEDQVILVDLDSKVLTIVLSLFYGISIPFIKTVIEELKDALKLFEIDETLVTIAITKETGEKEKSIDNITTAEAEVNHEDEQQPINRIHTKKHIDCPFQDCCLSYEQKHLFLKHLCDHFKNEIEEMMKQRKLLTSCAHQDCQFTTKSNDIRGLRYHYAIKHKHVHALFANSFPNNPLIKELKLF